MINSSFEVYKTVHESEMNAKWANDCVSGLRRDWRPIVNVVNNAINKNYLFSRQSMVETEALFKDRGEFMKIRNGQLFPIPILENVKNIFVEELTKNPPKAELTATDPAAFLDKQYDINLFKTKGMHERNMNRVNAKVGEPPEMVGKDKFKGSMEGLDNMDLDASDPDDQNFFYQNNRMKYEIAGQSLVNSIMKLGRFDEDTIEDFVVDILSDKVICMDVYVDKITGEIKYDYIYPETYYGLFGKRSDGSDDVCHGYQKTVTVNEFLQKVGNNFIWDRDWRRLLWAINYRAANTYTGFIVNNIRFDCSNNGNWSEEAGIPANTQSNLIEWTLAYTYEVYMGKIQWKVPQVTSNYKYKNTGDSMDTSVPASMPNDYQITEQDEVEGYQLETFYQQQTYEAYFIATSAVSQWIYGWGKVYHQLLHGANDEYSSGTIQHYRKRGLSAVELSIPYLKLANDAFYKMVWAVYEAHPDWEVYQVEELTQLAKVMYSQAGAVTPNAKPNDVQNQLTKLIKYFRNNLVKLKAIPRVDGKPQVGMNNTPVKEHRGLDPIAIAMQAVTTWAEQAIFQKLGINDLRQGNIANAREGFKQNELETKFSMNVTGYVYRMVSYMKNRVATTTLLLAQDIIKFKDSIPYKWVRKLVGEEHFENLKVIGEFSAHRFGIVVEDINTAQDKQKIEQAANMALDKGDGRGGLSFDDWFMIISAEDYKQAAKMLTFLKLKADKKKRKQELETLKIQQENAMQLKQAEAAIKQQEQKVELAKTKMITEASVKVAELNAQSKEKVKEMGILNEPVKQDGRVSGQKQVIEEKANVEAQKALT